MIEPKKQINLFRQAIKIIEKLECFESVKLTRIGSVNLNNKENFKEDDYITGFPFKIEIYYEIPEVDGEMCLSLKPKDDFSSFNGIEIVSIDINKQQYKEDGNGRRLIEQAKILMKEFKCNLYGDLMRESKGFYSKLGFKIENGKFELKYK